MPHFTGAQIITRLLERQQVRTIPGIPGGCNLPIYDALSQSSQIRHVLARHEQGAGFMAQGMARVSGRAECFLATSGPGATNVITALADARMDSIPVVCITGQVPLSLIGTDAFQEVDIYGMTVPITKHNFLVRSTAELLDVIPQAFAIAASGRPGPVLVDIPKDVQMKQIDVEHWPEPGVPEKAPAFNREHLAAAAQMINAARRPVLYVGGGVIGAGASDEIVSLAEKASIPTTMTLMGLGAISCDHPLAMGMLGMHAARYTNMVLEECDLLIACGARFDDRATGKVSQFCPNAKIIHIDIDPAELGKIKSAHIGITGDVKQVLEALLPLIQPAKRTDWIANVDQLRQQYPLLMPGADDPRTPYGVIRSVAALLDDEAIIATDVGQHQMFTAQAYPLRRPRRWLTSGGLGTMGFGMPAAIGAALARPEATVVSFSGDGSIMMNIQELATAVEQNLNVKIVIMNNKSLGLVHQQQDLFYGKRYFACDYTHHVDFPMIARGFGMQAFDLAGASDPKAVLAQALSMRGPCLIHAPVSVDQQVLPMVPPGAANKDMIGGFSDVEALA